MTKKVYNTDTATLHTILSKFAGKRNTNTKFSVTVGKRVDNYDMKDYEFIYFLDASVTCPFVELTYEDGVPCFAIHGKEDTYFVLREDEVSDVNVRSITGEEWSEEDKVYIVYLTADVGVNKIDYMIIVKEDIET